MLHVNFVPFYLAIELVRWSEENISIIYIPDLRNISAAAVELILKRVSSAIYVCDGRNVSNSAFSASHNYVYANFIKIYSCVHVTLQLETWECRRDDVPHVANKNLFKNVSHFGETLTLHDTILLFFFTLSFARKHSAGIAYTANAAWGNRI